MNAEWTSALSQALLEVFENLCFMVPSSPPNHTLPERGDQPRLVLAVEFSGAGRGELLVTLPDTMVASVASAMLGQDEPPALEEQYDAVRELANILCGNVLPRIAGKRAVFEVASPRILANMTTESQDAFDASAHVRVDEGVICAAIALSLEPKEQTS